MSQNGSLEPPRKSDRDPVHGKESRDWSGLDPSVVLVGVMMMLFMASLQFPLLLVGLLLIPILLLVWQLLAAGPRRRRKLFRTLQRSLVKDESLSPLRIRRVRLGRVLQIRASRMTVRLRFRDHGNGNVELRVRLDPPLPSWLRILRRTGRSTLPRAGVARLGTGDRKLDELVALGTARPEAMSAILDVQTRGLLVELMEETLSGRSRVTSGGIHFFPRGETLTAAGLHGMIRRLILLARRLTTHIPDVPARLEELVLSDPVPGVRRRCLGLLYSRFPGQPSAERALEGALQDPGPEVRFLAARLAGPRGIPILVELVRSGDVPEELRRQVLLRYGATAAPEELEVLLVEVLEGAPPDFRAEVIRGLNRLARRGHRDRLLALDPVAEPGPAAAALAEGLTRLGGEEVEARLLALMAREEEDVQLKALAGLERHGGEGAALPLKELARSAPRAEVRQAARAALAAVAARLGEDRAGQLFLTGEDRREGELALSAEGGRLTLPGSERGRRLVARRLDEVFPELRAIREPRGGEEEQQG